MVAVRFCFDFISPYSYLALAAAKRFARENGVTWELRPVVYAKLLDATGLAGPAENEVKRRQLFADILRCAHRAGVPLVGPPAHPFRSLEALRTVTLHRGHERQLDLAVALADACWGKGRDLTSIDVLADVVAGLGLDATSLGERIAAPEVKEALAASTQEALAAGAFGVPTFLVNGELFWGQDRLPHLADYLAGRLPAASDLTGPLLSRPRGADRPARPRGAKGST